jgi:hypothetical protein
MKPLATIARISTAVGIVSIAIAACGGSSSVTRNAEGDAVACVSQSDSAFTSDGQLELHFCAQATQWVREDEGPTYSEKMTISNGKAITSLNAFGSMKVISYDAAGALVGVDKITLNGSRGGLTYKVNTTANPVVISEVARAGWSGTPTDPNVSHSEAETLVTNFNNASAPAADWGLPTRADLGGLFENDFAVRAAGIDISGRTSAYWLSGKIDGKAFGVDGVIYGVLRSVAAPGGFAYWQRVEAPSTMDFVRPTRNFTPGDGPAILVAAGYVPDVSTSSSIALGTRVEEPTTSAPEVTIADSPEQVTRISIISPKVPVIELAPDEQVVRVTPVDVKKYIAETSLTQVKTAEIQFDGGEWIALSLSSNTDIQIPATAKNAVMRITSPSGDTYQVPKSIVRIGENVTTTTETIQVPAVAAPVVGAKSDEESDFGYIAFAIPVVLLLAIGIAARRYTTRRK